MADCDRRVVCGAWCSVWSVGCKVTVPNGTSETNCLIQAIDPGTEKSAIVELRLPEWEVVRHEILANDDVVRGLGLPHWYEGQVHTVIEMIASYGMPVGAEVFETCVWIGRFLQAADYGVCGHGYADRTLCRMFRREVKLELCDSARANDANVRAALIDLFGPGKAKAIGLKKTPGPLYGVKADEWAALGVAVTYARRLEACG